MQQLLQTQFQFVTIGSSKTDTSLNWLFPSVSGMACVAWGQKLAGINAGMGWNLASVTQLG
jgi:hypothetical protein